MTRISNVSELPIVDDLREPTKEEMKKVEKAFDYFCNHFSSDKGVMFIHKVTFREDPFLNPKK